MRPTVAALFISGAILGLSSTNAQAASPAKIADLLVRAANTNDAFTAKELVPNGMYLVFNYKSITYTVTYNWGDRGDGLWFVTTLLSKDRHVASYVVGDRNLDGIVDAGDDGFMKVYKAASENDGLVLGARWKAASQQQFDADLAALDAFLK